MIETCGQKPMKTPNGHNMQVFHGPVFDQQPHVPNRPQAYSTAGHATHLEGELWVQGAQVEAGFSQGGADKTNLEI